MRSKRFRGSAKWLERVPVPGESVCSIRSPRPPDRGRHAANCDALLQIADLNHHSPRFTLRVIIAPAENLLLLSIYVRFG